MEWGPLIKEDVEIVKRVFRRRTGDAPILLDQIVSSTSYGGPYTLVTIGLVVEGKEQTPLMSFGGLATCFHADKWNSEVGHDVALSRAARSMHKTLCRMPALAARLAKGDVPKAKERTK